MKQAAIICILENLEWANFHEDGLIYHTWKEALEAGIIYSNRNENLLFEITFQLFDQLDTMVFMENVFILDGEILIPTDYNTVVDYLVKAYQTFDHD